MPTSKCDEHDHQSVLHHRLARLILGEPSENVQIARLVEQNDRPAARLAALKEQIGTQVVVVLYWVKYD